jgi:hypothetical protein
MEAGATFLRVDADNHLWVVISDPTKDPDNVLIVNLTTSDERKERACILRPGDHPWIKHETCVNYGDSVVTTLAKLNAAIAGNALRVQATMPPDVLKKIRNGVLDSDRIATEREDILLDQGLIDS